jgi:alanyl aminopeptidase
VNRTLLLAVALALTPACRTTDDPPPAPPSTPRAPTPPSDGRLPRDVTPLAYRLALDVDPGQPGFAGRVDIEIELTRPRDHIWLHAEGLTFSQAQIITGHDSHRDAHVTVHDDGFAVVSAPQTVPPGTATLSLVFNGRFDEALDALYRVKVGDDDYAFTQFEPLAARRAFPCFDEPGFKTPFEIALTVPVGLSAASNGPLVSKRPLDDETMLWRFAPTRALPTYLVALAVGPLDIVDAPPVPASAVREQTVALRGIAARGRGKELAFALRETPKLLALLEAYFGTPYPYAKLDIVAVPDFAAGAMENAGLVTFRDMLLLIDEKNAPLKQKKYFAETMAHELAHQWFGNLVTMAWWDDLWLNEAFATWIAYEVTDDYAPAWQIMDEMLSSTQWAMGEDSLASSRRIREPITSSGDILNAFDGITYSKGGAVIDMFEGLVSPAVWRQGVRDYLREHADGSATVDDLLYRVSLAAGRDVTTPFRSFLDQAGVPFLKVTPRCEGERATLHVEQSRYLPLGPPVSEGGADPAVTWGVPFCPRYGGDGWSLSSCFLLDARTTTVELEAGRCPRYVHPNSAATGYYRWSLPAADLARLADHVSSLSTTERVSFADSVVAANSQGALDVGDALDALDPLVGDREPAVVKKVVGFYATVIMHLLDDETQRAAARARLAARFTPVLDRLGLSPKAGERPQDGELRALALDVLIGTGDERVLQQAAALGRAYLGLDTDRALHPEAVAPDLVGAAVRAAVRAGGAETYDSVLTRLLGEEDALVRRHLLGALVAVKDPALLARSLALAVDERLRVNEWYVPLVRPMSDARTRDAAWSWVKDNWAALHARVPGVESGYLPYSGQGLCSAQAAADVKAFFEPKLSTLQGGERPLAQTVESITLCTYQRGRHADAAKALFNGR